MTRARSTTYRRGDGLARTVVLVTGTLLVVAGGASLSRGLGIWDGTVGARGGTDRSDTPVVAADVERWFSSHADVFWPSAAGAGLLLALLGALLLRRSLRARPAKAGTVDLTDDATRGTTRVPTGVATSAFVADLAAIPGVEDAAAAMRGDPAQPLIDVRLDVADDADIAGVLDEVESGSLRRLEESLELRPAGTAVEVRLREPAGRHLS